MNYTDPKTWHEAANLFPLLSATDLDDLATDIKENGLLNPVILHEGKVLDGRNRLLACKKAGIIPDFTRWDTPKASALSWVISQNLRRRHLEPGQRAAIAVEAKPLLAAEAKKNQRAAGNPLGKAKSASLKNEKSVHKPIHVEKTVASQFDVSQGYVYAAQKIKDRDERVFQELKLGTLTIPAAEKKLGIKDKMRGPTSSDTGEWYTPKKYLEAARSVLGTIDLDPASCVDANNLVQAEQFFSKESDGLKKAWVGKVWLNPPYGDIGPKFVSKLLHSHESGNVPEAILLVSAHSVETKWFKPLFNYMICFTDHRLKFWNESGFGESPAHGSAFVYLGKHHNRFAAIFGQFGAVVIPYKPK